MKAITVSDPAAGVAGMRVEERPAPHAAENDVIVRVRAAGFTPGELEWPATWTDRAGHDRTPAIPGHELAGIVTGLGYGTTGLTVGQRVFGLADWARDGTLAEFVAVEARNLAPLPADVDFVTAASLPISGLTAWQALFQHGGIQAGQTVLVTGAAGGVGSLVVQLAREAGAVVIGTGRAGHRDRATEAGAHVFVDTEELDAAGSVDLVVDVLGGDVGARALGLVRPGGRFVTIAAPPASERPDVTALFFVVEPSRVELEQLVARVRAGALRSFIGDVVELDGAPAAFAGRGSRNGKTIVRVAD
ncbi:NADPH:quinone reductase [Leifsonia sp. 98AMF]|uniref:NADP-dependent oxidoreductase n=1 Tax=unclassified Leifsonia TaxID=2663824 RepID=UPI00087C1045|nr:MULTISPECIES: NADP-dependent oxidoreductase [unclassified Leifsonia]SDH10030.1 NADPH:quinone reductase [Leifsonia sp. 197AMF]SDJ29176.1 NADPH:quinone reductase [Leifsonia sp. 466MF]SDK51488.1 NADPH:quinone reductase [Leifsonia sp. 157MF]SDN51021.1 NADPH:quinone reductase [Leifsonia sp. 509MF]SEN59261.1 NADPH:quinone reductase [Leifsonia sp. 467MF]